MKFRDLFPNQKPLIGMIHTGSSFGTALDQAKEEVDIYLRHGVHPLVENYFGSVNECEMVLAWLQREHPDAVYGVNILGDCHESFCLAKEYGASFVQVDSVCGHLKRNADAKYARKLASLRELVDVVVLGGVRFKYQPVQSGRSLEEDLKLGAERCDAVVCTGTGTGEPTPFGKVREFKSDLKDFPVLVGAGVTLDTVQETFRLADGAIVGSWFKAGHHDYGAVKEEYVAQMVEKIYEIQ